MDGMLGNIKYMNSKKNIVSTRKCSNRDKIKNAL